MEEGEEQFNSDSSEEANVFHGMEECKVGEATSSRYEDITNTFDQVTITEQHSCSVYFLQDVGNHIKSTSPD
nr:hypothetical protein CFP56_58487 [Quercus suber]